MIARSFSFWFAMDDDETEFKVVLLLSEAINVWQLNKKLTKVALAEKLLKERNLSLVKIPEDPNDPINRSYQAAKEVIRHSLSYVIKKWKADGYRYANCNPHDIFFDLSVSI